MESPPSLEMLKGAVQALYHDPQKATEANRWLTEFQVSPNVSTCLNLTQHKTKSSPFAWNLAKDITSGKEGTFSTEVDVDCKYCTCVHAMPKFAFFAANVLVQKARRDVHQLRQEVWWRLVPGEESVLTFCGRIDRSSAMSCLGRWHLEAAGL